MPIVAAVLVIVTLIAMTTRIVPPILALVCALVVAGFLRIATPSELFAGLSNGGIITVGAMLVIAKGVLATGIVTRVTYRLLSGVSTAAQALRRLVPPVGVVSSLINTTPIVAMLIPATKELQQNSGVPTREVLLPIAHATTLAGSMTLIGTSSNLLIAGIASRSGVQVTMFDFLPIAAPVAVIGWVVLLFTSRWMLKGAREEGTNEMPWRVEIPISAKANAVGRSAATLGVATTLEFELLEIQRWGKTLPADSPIEEDDVLVYKATETGVTRLWTSPRFGLSPQHLYQVTVGADDTTSVRELEEGDDLMVVAARSENLLRKTRTQPGDILFVTTPSAELLTDHPQVGLWQDVAGKAPQTGKTWIALLILLAVIVGASFGIGPVELIAVAGAALMVATGVITPRSAVRALDWNILFILAGSVGLGAIVVNSGLGDIISNTILDLSRGNTLLVVVVLAIATTVLTNVVTNAAAAAILTPVTLSIAVASGLNPVLLLTMIGTCISFTFINPFSHQTNLMVMKPGGYSDATFAKFGIPVLAVSMVSVVGVSFLVLSIW